MNTPATRHGHTRTLLAILLPLPIIPVVAGYLILGPHNGATRILMAPGMVAFPLIVGKLVHPHALFFTAALFWYCAAAALLHAFIVPRSAGRRTFFWVFIGFSGAVAYTAWRFSGWNPD